jgi:hypothetical protein
MRHTVSTQKVQVWHVDTESFYSVEYIKFWEWFYVSSITTIHKEYFTPRWFHLRLAAAGFRNVLCVLNISEKVNVIVLILLL